MKTLLVLFCFLVLVLVLTPASHAQAQSASIGTFTVSTLPANQPINTLATVSDGSGVSCTVGGGSNNVLCRYTGSVWVVVGSNANGTAAVSGINCEPAYLSTTANLLNTLLGTFYVDCFSGSDVGAQINNAITAAATVGVNSPTLVLGANAYTMTTAVAFNTNLNCPTITGQGTNATTVTWTPTSGTAFTFNCMQSHLYGYGLRDFRMTGPGGGTAAVGLELGGSNGADGFNMYRTRIQDFGTDILYGSNAWSNYFESDYIADTGGGGILLNYPASVVNSGETIVFQKTFFSCSSSSHQYLANAVRLDGAGEAIFSFVDSSFDNCAPEVGASTTGRVSFDHVHWENPGTGGQSCTATTSYYAVFNGGSSTLDSVDMLNDCTSGTGPAAFFDQTGSSKVTVIGSSFSASGANVVGAIGSVDSSSSKLTIVGTVLINNVPTNTSPVYAANVTGQLDACYNTDISNCQFHGFQTYQQYLSAKGFNQQHRAVTTYPDTVLKTDFWVTCNATGTEELPATPVDGQILIYTNNASNITCTLDGNGNSVGSGTQLILTQPFTSAMLQYNAALTTWSYFSWFGTNGSPATFLYTGTASTPTISILGVPYSGGTGTTNEPQTYLSNSTATAVTNWSTSGTYLGINAASGFGGNFLDFHVNGGSSVFSVSSTGQATGVTPSAGDNTTKLATTAFVATSFAPIASPTFTGTATIPNLKVGTSTTQTSVTGTDTSLATAGTTVANSNVTCTDANSGYASGTATCGTPSNHISLVYIGQFGSGTGTYFTLAPMNRAINIDSATLWVETAAATCTTYPTIAVYDRTTSTSKVTATLLNGTTQYNSIDGNSPTVASASVAANDVLAFRVTGAASSCTTLPTTAIFDVQYH